MLRHKTIVLITSRQQCQQKHPLFANIPYLQSIPVLRSVVRQVNGKANANAELQGREITTSCFPHLLSGRRHRT